MQWTEVVGKDAVSLTPAGWGILGLWKAYIPADASEPRFCMSLASG